MQGTIFSNRYVITEEISMGGMGMVYRGTDLRTGGDVAIKVPHAFLTRNPEYMERLRREAQIAASIYSPRVVRVIDLDMHEGVPYIVMEYVPGETLTDIARARGRFTLTETLTLGVEVARALDAAHAKGIVHRDLKPQNIKLVDGEVKVLDFGIAKSEGMSAVTSASVFMGTPEYCAPERGMGEGDIRSDIYSLGVILFEMNEGHLPFQATSPMALMRKHESETPPPLTGDTPTLFREIVSRCLAKDPKDRYQTPRELAQALRLLLESAPNTLPQTLTPDGLPQTVKQVRDTNGSLTPLPAAAHTGGASLVSEPSPEAVGQAHVPPARSAPNRRMLAVAGLIAAVLLGGVVAAFVVTRGGGGTVEQTTTAVAAVPSPPATTSPTSTPAQSATPARSSTPQGPLLLSPGQQKSLPGVQSVEFALSECPGVKTVLQPTSIRMEQGGRVAVAYTVSVPRVQGVECLVDYPRDAQCSCMVLQTRLASGRTIEARNTGGAGVSATGADDIYGAAPVAGEWWWDRGVDMDGDELSLLRLGPGTDVPLFRIPLLRQ